MEKKVIFIENTRSFINTAIEIKLKEAGYEVIKTPDDMEEVEKHRDEADILLYFPEGTSLRIDTAMRYLTSLSRDEHKTLCLIGEQSYINRAKKSEGGEYVRCEFVKPLNISLVIADILRLSEMHEEYRRKKTILIIDDDRDYRTVLLHWLKQDYEVAGAGTGKEALELLKKSTPDLILLNYEMPDIAGHEILDRIHKNPLTFSIPIIFLTEKNDHDSVADIISHKPDGYLFKSLKKNELLDDLERFFSESILVKGSRQG
ncbi:MAG TPA: hypothetical protein DCL38_01100 [Lachnospiraceae bacterium]|nr:hypothetical protein [Lachnospiraceae bacterium]